MNAATRAQLLRTVRFIDEHVAAHAQEETYGCLICVAAGRVVLPVRRGDDAHPGTTWVWQEDGTCSFCGSIDAHTVVQALTIDEIDEAWTYDMSLGWPSAFTFGEIGTFEVTHLFELESDQEAAVRDGLEARFGVEFDWTDTGKLRFATMKLRSA